MAHAGDSTALRTLWWPMVALVLLLSACRSGSEADVGAQLDNPPDRMEADTASRHCFLKTFRGEPIVMDGKVVQEMIDSTQLYMTVHGDTVEGVFNYLPAERDSRRGTFAGERDAQGKVRAIYVFDEEGLTYKEGLIVELDTDSVRVKLAELAPVQGRGALVVLDNDAEFEVLPSVDCSRVSYVR